MSYSYKIIIEYAIQMTKCNHCKTYVMAELVDVKCLDKKACSKRKRKKK